MAKRFTKKARGFTLIEILIVIGIIAVLAAIVIIAINPAKQFAQARNTERTSDVGTILNAIGQRIADNKGVFDGDFTIDGQSYSCPKLDVDTEYDITSDTGANDINLNCLTPTYIPSQIPVDPNGGSWIDKDTYDTHYHVKVDSAGRYTVSAPNSADEKSLPDTGTISLTR